MQRLVTGSIRRKSSVSFDSIRALSATILAVFALIALFQLLNSPKQSPLPEAWHQGSERQPVDPKDDEKLVHDATVLETGTLVLQPDNTKSVVVLFHRCGHTPLQWWHTTLGCHNCFGLPEQIAITRAALTWKMGVIAVKARSKRNCWDTHHELSSKDVTPVLSEVKRVESLMGWTGLPRYALGLAEGGGMALILAHFLKFEGVCSMIMGVAPELFQHKPTDEDTKVSWQFPPTIFVHMARDTTTAAWVKEDVKALKHLGVPAKEIVVKELSLSKSFFLNRVPGLPANASAALYTVLQNAELINSDGALTKDPRPQAGFWAKFVKDPLLVHVKLTHQHVLGIQQELNVAYAGHEVTSDRMAEVLEWFRKPEIIPSTRLTINGAFMPQPLNSQKLP